MWILTYTRALRICWNICGRKEILCPGNVGKWNHNKNNIIIVRKTTRTNKIQDVFLDFSVETL
jgi:hypothetical protein